MIKSIKPKLIFKEIFTKKKRYIKKSKKSLIIT